MCGLDLERLYDEHAEALYAFLLNLTRDEADTRDLLQDIFVKLARAPDLLASARDERAFLIRLAHNAAIDLIRRRGTRAKTRAVPGRYSGNRLAAHRRLGHVLQPVQRRCVGGHVDAHRGGRLQRDFLRGRARMQHERQQFHHGMETDTGDQRDAGVNDDHAEHERQSGEQSQWRRDLHSHRLERQHGEHGDGDLYRKRTGCER